MATTPVVKPEVIKIQRLLDSMVKGRLLIPAFQRPFEWKPSDMLDLFESIYLGYPIGALLFWETREPKAYSEKIGPLKVKRDDRESCAYVLDGQQRLTTLLGCMPFPEDAHWKTRIFFDLKSKRFAHVPKGSAPPHYFPMSAVFKTISFLAVAKTITEHYPDDAEELIQEAELLAQMFQDHEVAVTMIKNATLEQAVETFTRLNTRGKTIKPDQMVSALTYTENGQPHLAAEIDKILELLSLIHFDGTSRMTVLQTVLAAAGIKIHRFDWAFLARKLEGKLAHAIDKAGQAMVKAAEQLSKFGVPGDLLLPYSNQFYVLAVFFLKCPNPSADQIAVLEKWFWVTSYCGWFAGANTTVINRALEEMESFAGGKKVDLDILSRNEAARPLPDTFHLRSARIRTQLLFLLTSKPLDTSGNLIEMKNLVNEQRRWFHIFPDAPPSMRSNPANRILLPMEKGMPIKTQLCSISMEHRARVLESHCIPVSAYPALESDDAEGFINQRTRFMTEKENLFISKHGLRLAEPVIGELEIDADPIPGVTEY